MNARLPVLLALAAALGCGAKVANKAQEKQAPYVFPHSTHVDADVACTKCHDGIDKAAKLEAGVRHVKIPPSPSRNEACKDCHDADPTIAIPAREAPPRFSFSHADHVKRAEGDCKRCHQRLTEKGDKEPKRPPMSACTSCHDHAQDFARARCTPCHVDLKGYQPETAFAHAGDWIRAHGALAKPSADACASCHDQTYCAECHAAATTPARPSIVYPERVERSFIHRGDYVSRHMVDAGVTPASCRRCHGSAFCEACHTQQNLTKFSDLDPHRRPGSHDRANWGTPGAPGSMPAHGPAARRDVSSCAGCHDQGTAANCRTCHVVGGLASANKAIREPGNTGGPHPSSFISKHRGDDKTKGICGACHPS